MEQRQAQYTVFRQMIAVRAKYFFIMMLTNRHYIGKMQFDHKREMLNLSVSIRIFYDVAYLSELIKLNTKIRINQ